MVREKEQYAHKESSGATRVWLMYGGENRLSPFPFIEEKVKSSAHELLIKYVGEGEGIPIWTLSISLPTLSQSH